MMTDANLRRSLEVLFQTVSLGNSVNKGKEKGSGLLDPDPLRLDLLEF
jgi:hypothetical protein